jgi:drug/metabolite transporter (DMT)-like permease
VALGAVIGFPALSALALRSVSAHHGVLVSGVIPFFTAVFAAWLGGERPSRRFWVKAVLGLGIVLFFGWLVHPEAPGLADVWLVLSAISAAWAYAQGAALARKIGGFRVIAWALVVALPLTAGALLTMLGSRGLPQASSHAWIGFSYVSVISMFLAFIAWYRGLALASVTIGSQLQLAQPALGVMWSALLLGESVSSWTLLELVLVAVLVASSRPGSRRLAVSQIAIAGPQGFDSTTVGGGSETIASR